MVRLGRITEKNILTTLALNLTYLVLVYPKDPTILVLFINYYNLAESNYSNFEDKASQEIGVKRMTQSLFKQISKLKSANDISSSERNVARKRYQSMEHFQVQVTYLHSKCLEEISSQSIVPTLKTQQNQDQQNLFRRVLQKVLLFNDVLEICEVKFNQQDTSLAILYTQSFSIYDLTTEQEMPVNHYVKVDVEYEALLDVEFSKDQNMEGMAAYQANIGYNQTQIHLYKFSNKKPGLIQPDFTYRAYKFQNNFINNAFNFKFSQNLDKAIFCIIPKSSEFKSTENVVTYIIDLQSESKYELQGQKQLRSVSVLQNSEEAPQRPFIGLGADELGNEIQLLIEDSQVLKINFPFNSNNTQIIFFDSRIIHNETKELQIRFGLLVDKEKLNVFTYREANIVGFDGLLNNIVRSFDTLPYANTNNLGLQYREYEEFQISNFVYPCLAYNYLSQQIRIVFMDKFNETLNLKIPVQSTWARVNLMRLTSDGKNLQFLLEDSSNLMLFQYNIEEKALINQEQPLITIKKSSFPKNDHIHDFFCKVTNSTRFAKKFMKGQNTYDVKLYLLSYPSKILYHLKLVQNLPNLQRVSENVTQMMRKNKEFFLITHGKFIEQIMQKKLNYQSQVVYQIPEGQIMQLITCNDAKQMWMLTKNEQEYNLVQIKLTKAHKFQKVKKSLKIKDKALINLMLSQSRYGYIELSKQFKSMVYIANNQLYIINKEEQKNEQKQILHFDQVIQLQNGESVLNNYPQVHSISQKIINIIKKIDGRRVGLIMPTLYSDNKLRLRSLSASFIQNEKVYSTIVKVVTDQGQEDLIFEFNISQKTVTIMNIKGQIIQEENIYEKIKEKEEDLGEIIAMSDSGEVFAFLNDHKNVVTLYEFVLLRQGNIMISKLQQFQLPKLGVTLANLQGAIGALGNLFKSKDLEDGKKKPKILINDNKFMLLSRQVGELIQITLYSHQKDQDGNIVQQDIVLDYDKYLGDYGDYINASLSNEAVIIWSKSRVLIYKIKEGMYKVLSIQLCEEDILQFIDVYQVRNEGDKYMLRIMNSFETHMIVLWDEEKKTEECSADVNYFARVIQDHDGRIYIMDNEQGLIGLNDQSAACKNLSFRHILEQQFKNKARQLLVQQNDYYLQAVTSFYKKGTIGCKVALEKREMHTYNNVQQSAIKYLVLRRQVILPYSYLQLMIKDSLENIQLQGEQQGIDNIKGYYNFVNQVPIKHFQFQIKNSTLLHYLANDSRELEYFLRIFKKKDEAMLDMLMTLDQQSKTPLHLAFENNNTRSINIIMSYMAHGCQENFGKYTKIFQKEFKDFINYSSFKVFMEAAFYQSDQFKQIKSLKVKNQGKLEDIGILIEHETIIKDQAFLNKLSKEEQTLERNVQVNVIRSDWLLQTDDGLEFLSNISKSEDMEIFQLKVIQTIINYMWGLYKWKIITRLFIPFIIYFIVFILAITYLYFDVFGTNQKKQNDVEDQKDVTSSDMEEYFATWIHYTVYALLLPMNLYFTVIEGIQLYIQKPKTYLNSGWNQLDILTCVFAFFIIIVMLITGTGQGLTVVNAISAILVICLYLKFFYFLRIFDRTAYFIRIIVQISMDVRYFLFIFLIALVGFGNGFLILSRGNSIEGTEFVGSFMESLFYTYKMTLGDFDTNWGSVNIVFSQFVFILATLLIMIILFNLLIAIMGDTYAQIKETEQQQTMKEQLQLILDNQFLVSAKDLCREVKYIISVTLDVEDQMSEMEKAQKKHLQELEEYIDNKFELVSAKQRDLELMVIKQVNKLLPTQNIIEKYLSNQEKRKTFQQKSSSSQKEEDSLKILNEMPARSKVTIKQSVYDFKEDFKDD